MKRSREADSRALSEALVPAKPRALEPIATLRRAPAPTPAERPRYEVNTYRLTRQHIVALRKEAHSRAEKFGGKPDASEVLRGLLDEWMARDDR